jgi:quercetin dioxygenase-like cupin family protein
MNSSAFNFHGIKMRVLLTTEQSEGRYGVIEMMHPPHVGPASHIHPLGAETFYVIEGTYTFHSNDTSQEVLPGQSFSVPAGVEHRYRVGAAGGKLLVICPPRLERYFHTVADMLSSASVPLEVERSIAETHGQIFSNMDGHWSEAKS